MKICFVGSNNKKILDTKEKLIKKYGNTSPEKSDVIVSLGGDGFLLQTIHNMYGINSCKEFLDNTQLLITRWMMKH